MTTTQQPTFDYGEPWKEEAYNAPIGDSGDYEGVIEIRTREELRVAEAWNPSDENKALFSRAIACVNACAGMVDPAKEIQAMREAIREVYNSFADEDSAWLLDDLQTAALTKLQPFIKP